MPDARHIVVLEPDVGYHMFVFLDRSRLGTVFLAHKSKLQFHTLKLSSLGHHPHSPGYGNSLPQHPQLRNQNSFLDLPTSPFLYPLKEKNF